jgi:hypothetical protein
MSGIPIIEVAILATKTTMNNRGKLTPVFKTRLKNNPRISISTGIMLRKIKTLPVVDKIKGAAILAMSNPGIVFSLMYERCTSDVSKVEQ